MVDSIFSSTLATIMNDKKGEEYVLTGQQYYSRGRKMMFR